MNRKTYLTGWVKVDGSGMLVPGSFQLRPYNVKMPKGWIRIDPDQCCGCDCIIVFSNTSADTDVTSIASTDGRISWTGTLAQGDMKSFLIPNCYNMEFTVTMSAPGATIDITATTTQGDGVIAADPDNIASGASPVTTTVTTTATQCSEYLVVIENA